MGSPQLSNKKVNPTGSLKAEILIIGESPGDTEEALNEPFVGPSGELLWNTLSSVGITRSQCRVHNLCNYKPTGNKFEYCEGTEELKEGLSEITDFILNNKELKLVILLGEKPLEFQLGNYGINRWRGSAVTQNGIIYLPTFHPAYVLRSGSDFPLFAFDLGKIPRLLKEGTKKYEFEKIIDPRGMELIEATNEILQWPEFTVDIESVRDSTHILCIGFAYKNKAICVVNHDGFGIDTEFANSVGRILGSESDKIFHNAIFDCEMLRLNGLEVRNLKWDTQVAQHILEPELSRSLAFLTSTYTDLPYFKDMGRSAIPDNEKSWNNKVDKGKLYDYNCMDVLSTYLVYSEQLKEIKGDFLDLFNYEMEMLEVSMHISQSGMLIDPERKNQIDTILTKRAQEKNNLLRNICGREVNVKSPKLKDLLYGEFGLPIRKTREGKITTDEDAIVSLIGFAKDKLESLSMESKRNEWMKKLAVLKLILEVRGIRHLLSNYVDMSSGIDNRVRSSWNVAATETGRWSASGYVDGTGGNNQTWPREVLEVETKE